MNILLPGCLSACILHEDSSIDVCGNLSFDGSSCTEKIATIANKELLNFRFFPSRVLI